jgi:hypothetical protein
MSAISGVGSGSLPLTLAVSLSWPAAVGLKTIATLLLAPTARLPTWNVRTPLSGVTPPVAETNVTPRGSVSVSVTPVATADCSSFLESW